MRSTQVIPPALAEFLKSRSYPPLRPPSAVLSRMEFIVLAAGPSVVWDHRAADGGSHGTLFIGFGTPTPEHAGSPEWVYAYAITTEGRVLDEAEYRTWSGELLAKALDQSSQHLTDTLRTVCGLVWFLLNILLWFLLDWNPIRDLVVADGLSYDAAAAVWFIFVLTTAYVVGWIGAELIRNRARLSARIWLRTKDGALLNKAYKSFTRSRNAQ